MEILLFGDSVCRQILKALCDHGADLNYVRPKIGKTVKEHFCGGAMAKLLAM